MLTLRKVAIKDPDSADMVILSNIMDGVDGAASFGFSIEDESVQVEDNQQMVHSHNLELDIRVLSPSSGDSETLDGLIGKRVEVSGWSLEGFLVFRDNVVLNRNPAYNSAIINDRVYITQTTPKGYVED